MRMIEYNVVNFVIVSAKQVKVTLNEVSRIINDRKNGHAIACLQTIETARP